MNAEESLVGTGKKVHEPPPPPPPPKWTSPTRLYMIPGLQTLTFLKMSVRDKLIELIM